MLVLWFEIYGSSPLSGAVSPIVDFSVVVSTVVGARLFDGSTVGSKVNSPGILVGVSSGAVGATVELAAVDSDIGSLSLVITELHSSSV